MSVNPRRPGRAPGTVNLVLTVAVLALLLPLLLNAATSSPPTAAEFSPNARQVIKQAPPGQAPEVSAGGEATPTPSAGPSVSPASSPTAQTIQPPENEVLKCVGPPPLRQIEDPQSPPCIAYWKGDNGGSTWRGVTKQAVYIAVPTPENAVKEYNALFAFFNKRFQFYGRKLVPEYCGTGSGASDQATQVADAAKAASGCDGGIRPFASTFYRQNNGAYYMPALACRHKILVMGSYSPYDKKFLDRCPGLQFQYPMVVDEQFANLGEWMCKRLVGRKATWADGNDGSTPPRPLNGLTRELGIILEPFTNEDPVARKDVLTPMLSRLRACGAGVEDRNVLVNPVYGQGSGNFDPASAQNAMIRLKANNVTSVVCMCNFFSYGTLARAAEGSAYSPEWISGTFGLNDVTSSFILSGAPDSQLENTFGVTFHPRIINPLLNPYNVAVQEGDPSAVRDTATTGEAKLEVYRALLLIASGVQMAGPHLTPATFRDGLRNARFPNPFHVTMAGAVDVRPDGYSLTADGAEWFYSTTAYGPFADSRAKAGAVCYLNGGRRYRLGAWPRGNAPFFSGSCDSGA
jgi:hypothetical protein